jgi:Arc/MetJ family transcription regulator
VARIVIDIDDAAFAAAARRPGTKTRKDTVGGPTADANAETIGG